MPVVARKQETSKKQSPQEWLCVTVTPHTQLLQAAQHDVGELALAATLGAEAVEDGVVLLDVALMEQARVNGSSKQVVGSRNGVDVASQMQIEVRHWNDL